MPWKDVFSAFSTAFPLTTRTGPAVVARWHRLHHRGKTNTRETRSGRGSRSEGNGQSLEGGQQGSAPLAAEPPQISSGTLLVAKSKGSGHNALASMAITSREDASTLFANGTEASAASRSPESPFTTPPLPCEPMDELEAMMPSYLQNAEANSASTAGVAAPRGPSAQLAAHTAAKLPRARNYTIDLHANGFVITNLPPGHQIRILSPTQCRVSVPAQLLTRSHNEEPQQQQDLLPEAAFAFEVRENGTIKALKLPQGTTRSGEVVETEEGQLRRREAFCGVDGYLVVFENIVQ